MDPKTDTPARSVDELLAALERGPGSRTRQAGERVGQALSVSVSATEPESGRLDGAVVASLYETNQPDPVLERVELDGWAALLTRLTRRAAHGGRDDRELLWNALDLVRRPSILRRIERDEIGAWSDRILAAVETSHLTVGPLFRQRAARYGSKPLFKIPHAAGSRKFTWRRVAARVETLCRGLLALDDDGPGRVAILSENRVEMALIDLACLTGGIVNVMVPANSTENDVGYILGHSSARTVVVSGRVQLRKVLRNRDQLPGLRHIVCIEGRATRDDGVISLESLAGKATSVPASEMIRRSEECRIDDLATVMYTSGTTGMPKAIMFTQRNLVFKRFARALALPEIGEDDVFLCFLPLFHTFGRFLEMLGCVFWGATYCLLPNPSLGALVRGLRLHRPTVFISVPKKWIQLYEAIGQRADPLNATDAELLQATREVTGGRLAWGLSAAGYLDPDIFRFFQSQNVQLLSGFGMTEATGGITMTPPGDYRENSLGIALPGIDLELAGDGELLIRGPYVMRGYLDPPDGETSFNDQGWLPTGDLMETDQDGHLRLIDRKKEIYKNVKGETVAPQRIENMFRDMESVGRVFLVGDHREYNTLLIHPNMDCREPDFHALDEEGVREHFRSLVVSVNKFLSPFERIVDFAVIDRDLDPEQGELTPKGTPRRQIVARNFDPLIRDLYRRANMNVGGVELVLPNWLIQVLGLTAQDLQIGEDRITLIDSDAELTVRRCGENLARVGSCIYRHPPGALNMGALTLPRLWLGNEELFRFVRFDLGARVRPGRPVEGIEWISRAEPYSPTDEDRQQLEQALGREDHTIHDLDLAARSLDASSAEIALVAVELAATIAGRPKGPLAEPARRILARGAGAASLDVRRRCFSALVPLESTTRFPETLRRFLDEPVPLLDETTRDALCERNLEAAKVDALVDFTQEVCGEESTERARLALALLRFFAAYGAGHPTRYRQLRSFLVRVSQFADRDDVRDGGAQAVEELSRGFRDWLGPNTRVAVDFETGDEYNWTDVVVFHESVDADDRKRLLLAIQETPMLREASFLFSKGVLIRLSDIPPGGVWVRLVGERHGKSVYRMTIQTRFQGSYDLAVNVNQSMAPEQVRDEIAWLILSGDPRRGAPLVEDFGGYFPEQDLWSEEFITGEPLDRALRRLSKRREGRERLVQLWPFLAWTSLSAYVEFWLRSGKRWEISDPSPFNVVVPTDDYLTGARLVSVSARKKHLGLPQMMRSFRTDFIGTAVEQYPDLEGLADWPLIFSAVVEVLGEDEGLKALRGATTSGGSLGDEMRAALLEYIEAVEVRGFLPRRLYFAAKRYRRWEELGEDPTSQARARTMQELYDTYGLEHLAESYPETRVRFFRETVFRDCPPLLAEGLEQIIAGIRAGETIGDELIDAVADLRATLDLGPDEEYFLARLSLPYLRPEDAADFVSSRLSGKAQGEIVVSLEDHEGGLFRVRHALNPKEVERLHRLFVAAKLDVSFRPEHRYLVAISERQQIIGGIYYESEEEERSAHLEKIVVTDAYRRKGVADGLIHDFFNRLRAAGLRTVTTGFFRPEYFYSYGFRIEKRYAGLVKSLDDPGPPAEPRLAP